MINYDDFAKVDLRIGKVLTAEHVEGSEKLLKLTVDLGDEVRQIIAGIASAYSPTGIIDKEVVVVANLEPKTIMGLESQGMLLAADDEMPVLLRPDQKVKTGVKIK